MSSNRFEILQGYRAIAAIGVVLHHINGKLSAPHYFGEQMPEVFSWGMLGVDFFFVLSGFIIAMCLARACSAREFLVNRALRIYPPFWIAFVVTLVVAVPLAAKLHTPVTSDPLAILQAALLLPQPNAPVIGVAWTLHHEVLFYLMAGAWLVFPRVVAVVAAVLLLGAFFQYETFLANFFFSPFHWEFAAGVAAFCLRHRVSVHAALPMAICAGLGAVSAMAWMWWQDEFWLPYRYVLMSGLFGILIAASTRVETSAEGGWFRRLAASLGDSSYTLYLWHISLVTPVTKAVRYLAVEINPYTGFALILLIGAATTALAHLIYRLIELPLVNSLRRRLSSREARAQTSAADQLADKADTSTAVR